MNNSLYSISKEYIELFAALEAEEGEMTPEMEQALTITKESFDNKVVGYGHVMRKKNNDIALIKAELEVIKAEEKRLKDRIATEETRIERMKEAVKDAMLLFGHEKVEHALFTLRIGKSEATIIENEDSIPLEYLNVVTTTTPDKKAIKKAIDSGIDVPGAYIEKRKNLQFK